MLNLRGSLGLAAPLKCINSQPRTGFKRLRLSNRSCAAGWCYLRCPLKGEELPEKMACWYATPLVGAHAPSPHRKWQAVAGRPHWLSATMTMGPWVSGQCLRPVGLFVNAFPAAEVSAYLYSLQPFPSSLLGSSPVVIMLTLAQHWPLQRIKTGDCSWQSKWCPGVTSEPPQVNLQLDGTISIVPRLWTQVLWYMYSM